MGLKSRNLQKAHLWRLRNLRIKFSLSRSIWREDKLLLSPLLIDLGGWFLDMLYNSKLSMDGFNKKQFLRFESLGIPFPNLCTTQFRPEVIPAPEYQMTYQSKPIPQHLVDFGQYWTEQIIFQSQEIKNKK